MFCLFSYNRFSRRDRTSEQENFIILRASTGLRRVTRKHLITSSSRRFDARNINVSSYNPLSRFSSPPSHQNQIKFCMPASLVIVTSLSNEVKLIMRKKINILWAPLQRSLIQLSARFLFDQCCTTDEREAAEYLFSIKKLLHQPLDVLPDSKPIKLFELQRCDVVISLL